MLPLVSLTLFLPLVGAVLILCLPKPTARTVHSIAIASAALTLVGALAMWLQGVSGDGFSQVEELVWMPAIGAAYRVGVDGISRFIDHIFDGLLYLVLNLWQFFAQCY